MHDWRCGQCVSCQPAPPLLLVLDPDIWGSWKTESTAWLSAWDQQALGEYVPIQHLSLRNKSASQVSMEAGVHSMLECQSPEGPWERGFLL